MNTKHTPTPWRLVESVVCANSDGRTDNVAACCHRQDSFAEANAAFIVHACNSHAALVAALEALLNMSDYEAITGRPDGDGARIRTSARAEILKANGA